MLGNLFFAFSPVFYFILFILLLKNNYLKKKIYAIFTNESSFYYFQIIRIIGFFLMFLTPFLINKKTLFFNFEDLFNLKIELFLLLILFVLPISYLNSKKISDYPEVKILNWNGFKFIVNIMTWGIYLFAYEYLFRGLLFLNLIPNFNVPLIIILNTLTYCIAHFHKSKKEIIACIPFGILICLITLNSGNILYAFFIHWIVAINNFIFSNYRYINNNKL